MTNIERESHDDDARFDRLVDGELPTDEYRALLAGLDDEPGGWRRCALAFLESQAMRNELVFIRRGGQIAETPRPTMRQATHRNLGWKVLLAMAASFVLAFGLGVYLPGWLRPSSAPPLAGPKLPQTNQLPPENRTPTVAAGNLRNITPVGNVRLVVDGPGDATTDAGELPIYEMNADTAQWFAQDQPAIPARYVQELERRGHRVQRQLEYMYVQLDDGRQVVVPVEGYQITPSRREPY